MSKYYYIVYEGAEGKTYFKNCLTLEAPFLHLDFIQKKIAERENVKCMITFIHELTAEEFKYSQGWATIKEEHEVALT